ncbi:MAG: TolC family protein [Candidatus Cryptobacteroides sp.]
MEVKNAALDVSSARALKQEAFTEYFPSVAVNAFGFYAFNPLLEIGLKDVLGESDGAHNLINTIETAAPLYGIGTSASFFDYGYNASVSITQPLYAGGRIVNGNKLAELKLKASILEQTTASKDKEVEVEEKYWKVVMLEEKMLTLNQALTTLDTLSRDVRNACKAGLALDTDSLSVNLERNRLLASKRQLKSGIRMAKMDLFNSIGMEYSYFSTSANCSAPWIDAIQLTDRPSGLLSPDHYFVDEQKAAMSSEESQLLSLNVEALRLQKKMALGEALPQIGIGAGYGYGRMIGDNGRWNGAVYAVVKIPLTDYWKSSCKMKRLENDALKAENQRDYLNDQLVLQVYKLWEELNCYYDKLCLADDDVRLCEIAESRTRSSYRSGQATISELLSSQTELRSAQDAHTEALINYAIALSAYKAKTVY